MSRSIAFVCVLVSACISGPHGMRRLDAVERMAVQSVEHTWQGAPIGEMCEDQRPRMRIVVAESHQRMRELTAYCGPSRLSARWDGTEDPEGGCPYGRAAAAFRTYSEGMWPFAYIGTGDPLIVLYHTTDRVAGVEHEARHWIEWCTGEGIDRHGR